jgi:hypothetical protein
MRTQAIRGRRRKVNRPGRWPKEGEVVNDTRRMASTEETRDRRF